MLARRQGRGKGCVPRNPPVRPAVFPSKDGAAASKPSGAQNVALRAFFLLIALVAVVIGFTLPTPGGTGADHHKTAQLATLDLN